MPSLANDPLTTQLSFSIVLPFILEKAKQAKSIPWIRKDTAALNRFLAVVLSGLAALGVHLTTQNSGDGSYVITITGLTLTSIATSLWAWAKSFIIQEVVYQKLIRSDGPEKPAVADQAGAASK